MKMHFYCLVFNIVSSAVSAGCSPQSTLSCGVVPSQLQKWENLLIEPHRVPVGPVSMSIHVIQSGNSDVLLNHFPPFSKSSLKFVMSVIIQTTDDNIRVRVSVLVSVVPCTSPATGNQLSLALWGITLQWTLSPILFFWDSEGLIGNFLSV